MTLKDAEKVAKIIATADGGCGPCVTGLAYECEEAWPEFEWDVDTEGINPVVTVKRRPDVDHVFVPRSDHAGEAWCVHCECHHSRHVEAS